MKYKNITPAQERSALAAAREKHDARFEIDHPQPEQKQERSQETGVEKSLNYLWVVWLIIGLAGALISLPHTVGTVTSTVELEGLLALGYAAAAFVGVELALIGVALVSALKDQEREFKPRKQASLAGLINSFAIRLGFRPLFRLDHLPDAHPATGSFLVGLLFVAALIFNLADALKTTEVLASLAVEISFMAKLTAGLLGPGLLLIAGHRFAHEIVRSASKRKRSEYEHQQALQRWEEEKQRSWEQASERYIQQALARKWAERNKQASRADNPYLNGGARPLSMSQIQQQAEPIEQPAST